MIGVQTDLFGAVTTAADGRRGYFNRTTYRLAEVRVHTVRESAAPTELRHCSRPEASVRLWRDVVALSPWFDPEKESSIVALLNVRNQLIGWSLLSIGSATSTVVSPREVLRAVVVANATAFVLMHNHPSGDPAPSSADVQVTRAIREAAKVVEVAFMDHLVIGEASVDPLGRGFYSFKEAGLL